MDKLRLIIQEIKDNTDKSEEEIRSIITRRFFFDGIESSISNRNISFLITLCSDNKELSNELLEVLFLTSMNRVEKKILQNVTNAKQKSVQSVLKPNLLNILTRYGSIKLLPENIILFWNNRLNYDIKKSITDLESIKGREGVLLKPFDYGLLIVGNTDNGEFAHVTDGYTRNFGLVITDGFVPGTFQLVIDTDIGKVFSSISLLYAGEVEISLGGTKKKFSIKEHEDMKNVFKTYKKEIIDIMRNNQGYAIQNMYGFVMNEIVHPLLPQYILALDKIYPSYDKQVVKNLQMVKNKEQERPVMIFNTPCPHIKDYEEILTKKKDNISYFELLNDYITKYIDYNNGSAICKECNENVTEFTIQGSFFLDKTKFQISSSNILQFPPYNKFSNIQYFSENIRYIFSTYAKMGIHELSLFTRLLVDFLIHISSNRIELEEKYRADIRAKNLFLLRLNNNFFDSIDVEKEMFKDERMKFTNIPAFIIILITSSMRDYYDFFFVKNKGVIKKISKDISKVRFDDAIVFIIDHVFKKIINDYSQEKESVRISNLSRTVQIYIEMMPEEIKFRYNDKKILFERFITGIHEQKQKGILMDAIIDPENNYIKSEFNELGQYKLNTATINNMIEEKIKVFYSKRKNKLYDIINIPECISEQENNIELDMIALFQSPSSEKDRSIAEEALAEMQKIPEFTLQEMYGSISKIEDRYVFKSNKGPVFFTPDDNIPFEPNHSFTHPSLFHTDYFLYKEDLTEEEYKNIMINFVSYIGEKRDKYISTNFIRFLSDIKVLERTDLFLFKIKCLKKMSLFE